MKIQAPFRVLKVNWKICSIFLLVPFVGRGYDLKNLDGREKPHVGRFHPKKSTSDYLFVTQRY